MIRTLRSTLAAVCTVLVLSGCSQPPEVDLSGVDLPGLPPLPPLPEPAVIAPTAPLPTPTPGHTTLGPDGFRTTERVAVRVRNVGCQGVTTGSGFALARDLLVTNRHVVAGAQTLQVSTYDGQDLLVETTGSTVVADLAIVRTSSQLPAAVTLAEDDPEVDDPIEVIGYPGGGRLSSSTGQVLGYEPDPLGTNAGTVIVTDAPAAPGSSGSPVYSSDGTVVGVVYAASRDGKHSLAVPVSTLRELLDTASFAETVPPCGG